MTIWPFASQRSAPKQMAGCKPIARHALIILARLATRLETIVAFGAFSSYLDCPIAEPGRLSVRLPRMRDGAVLLTAHASGWGPMLRVYYAPRLLGLTVSIGSGLPCVPVVPDEAGSTWSWMPVLRVRPPL